MLLEKIQTLHQTLKSNLSSLMADTLHEKIRCAYHQWVLREIEIILSTDKSSNLILAQKLRDFLRIQGAFVNQSAMSPTAIAHDPISRLLCQITLFVTKELQATEDCPISPLKYLIPTLEEDNFEPIEIDLALDDESQLIKILQSHLLGREGQFLFPVGLATELSLILPIDETTLKNRAYFGYEESLYYLTKEESRRLKFSSNSTTRLFDLVERYKIEISSSPSLLAKLLQLCQQLSLNSHQGFGTEEHAGTDAYDAIIKFNTFYEAIEPHEKERISPRIRGEIDKLIRLSSDPAHNIEGTHHLETCIASRRGALISSISGQEDDLEKIVISGAAHSSQLAQLQHEFETEKAELIQHLTEETLPCIDTLPITVQLLKGIEFDCTQITLEDIASFSPYEIETLFGNELIKTQILTVITDHEAFAYLLYLSSPEKVEVLIRQFKVDLIPILICTPSELNNVLQLQTPEICGLLWKNLSEHIDLIINSNEAFALLLEGLQPDQIRFIQPSLKKYSPESIQTPEAYNRINQSMTEKEQIALFYVMRKKLALLLRSGAYFGLCCQNLPFEQFKVACLDQQTHLFNTLYFAENLSRCLKFLNSEKRFFLLKSLREKVPELIETLSDLKDILHALPDKEEQIFLLDILKDKIRTIMPSDSDKALVYPLLVSDAQEQLSSLLKPSPILFLIPTLGLFKQTDKLDLSSSPFPLPMLKK